MPLINCKIDLELNWSKDCVMSTIADRTFKSDQLQLNIQMETFEAFEIFKNSGNDSPE